MVPMTPLFAAPFLPISLPAKGAIAGGALSWYVSELSALIRLHQNILGIPERTWKQVTVGILLGAGYGAAAFRVLTPGWATAFLFPTAVLFAVALHRNYPFISELPPVEQINEIHQAARQVEMI
jgi:hypothetical protein